MNNYFGLFFIIAVSLSNISRTTTSSIRGNTTNAVDKIKADTVPANSFPADSSLLANLRARCIGPLGGSISNGRVTDLAVYEKDPKTFYIASCGGGVFKTVDGGKTTRAVFDKYGSSSIGAVALSQKNPNIVWVGTGEGWQRNDIGIGDGIYKSLDGGKTWKNMGLPNSQSIAEIVIHPDNDNIVFVAVLGSAWGMVKIEECTAHRMEVPHGPRFFM